jgi:hypothetical protein
MLTTFVAKLKARERKRVTTARCEDRKSHVEDQSGEVDRDLVKITDGGWAESFALGLFGRV